MLVCLHPPILPGREADAGFSPEWRGEVRGGRRKGEWGIGNTRVQKKERLSSFPFCTPSWGMIIRARIAYERDLETDGLV